MPRISYVNGAFVPHARAAVQVEDRGLQFADSVYEVFALSGGVIADERGHLDRLERSLKELRIPMPMPRRALRLVMRELVRRNRILNGGIYMQVSRGVAPRDFRFPAAARPGLVMTLRPMRFDPVARRAVAKKVVTVPDIRWARRDIKSTMLLAQVLARQEALERGADDAWLVDAGGFVTEAAAANAWIVDRSGNLVTRPAAGNMILKGVTGSALRALCRKEKIKIVERPFTPAEACAAREAFMSSAVALFAPVVMIDGRKVGDGRPGPLTLKIIDLYFEYMNHPGRQARWQA